MDLCQPLCWCRTKKTHVRQLSSREEIRSGGILCHHSHPILGPIPPASPLSHPPLSSSPSPSPISKSLPTLIGITHHQILIAQAISALRPSIKWVWCLHWHHILPTDGEVPYGTFTTAITQIMHQLLRQPWHRIIAMASKEAGTFNITYWPLDLLQETTQRLVGW